MTKKVLISGAAGQDGSYLAEYLLEKGYEVHGIIRRNSVAENQDYRLRHIENDIKLHYGDVLGVSSLTRVMQEVKPDEIYSLAAQSHVKISFDIPCYTIQTNSLGVLNMLEAYKLCCPEAHFYQASSSECFGNSVELNGTQNENTSMHPVSPYGCAKVMGFNLVQHYRRAYNLFACNGILFNHTSPRRGSNFVESKIIKTAVEIKHRLTDKLVLGNLDSYRDFGHSADYVQAMNMILNYDKPDDFVIATGETHSIREIVNYIFKKLDLDIEKYVVQDSKFMRPEELKYLCGDSTKARTILGWKPKHTFYEILDEQLEYWLMK